MYKSHLQSVCKYTQCNLSPEGIPHMHSGKSPDLWVLSLLQPSQLFTSVFLKSLPNYSGRTVQDFHLIPFSSLQSLQRTKILYLTNLHNIQPNG